MNAILAAYKLRSDVGSQIAAIKDWGSAWSHPEALRGLLRDPGPLMLYDQIIIDQASYESYCDSLEEEDRNQIQSIVESDTLGAFRPVNIEDRLVNYPEVVNQVRTWHARLRSDHEFVRLMRGLQRDWGAYAKPDPLRFEAMNIPLMGVIQQRWSREEDVELTVIDSPRRAPLYSRYGLSGLEENLHPAIAQSLIRMLPFVYGGVPAKDTWSVDSLREIRENRHLEAYRAKVHAISRSAAERYRHVIETAQLPTDGTPIHIDHHEVLTRTLAELEDSVLEEVQEANKTLNEKLGANRWTILGAVVTIAAAPLGILIPPLGGA